jgi:hypothetical protein
MTSSSDLPERRTLEAGEARVIARRQRLAAARLTEEVRLLLRKDAATARRTLPSSASQNITGRPGA